MIYTNFLYFIIAIFLYVYAPMDQIPVNFSNLIFTILLLVLFANFNRLRFAKLKNEFIKNERSIAWLRSENNRYTFYHSIIAIMIFGLELYSLKVKKVFTLMPLFGESETFVDLCGVVFFMLHLIIIWFYSSRILKGIISDLSPTSKYLTANFKFNLVIVIPWILFTFFREALFLVFPNIFQILSESILYNFLIFFIFLILIITIFAPLFIFFLWDCKPIKDQELLKDINSFLKEQKVKFSKILSWKALNNSLVSAAVVGIIPPFRLLLITPRLKNLLNKDEIIAVVAHEVGHVKKRHMYFYIFFFLLFFILSYGILNFTVLQLLLFSKGEINLSILNFITFFVTILLFIVFFRYVFAYFMRNFERQADLFCFEAGVNPDHLISAFEKLQALTNEDKRKKNWHHFNIYQRITVLREAKENPSIIQHHDKKIKKHILILIGIAILLFVFFGKFYSQKTENQNRIRYYLQQIDKLPQNKEVNAMFGLYFYEMKNWEKAVKYYTSSLMIEYNQPSVLNNLAWLLLKCPEPDYHQPELALQYAKDSVKLEKKAYNLDTLAEAYLQNNLLKEALSAAQESIKEATANEKRQMNQRFNEIKREIEQIIIKNQEE